MRVYFPSSISAMLIAFLRDSRVAILALPMALALLAMPALAADDLYSTNIAVASQSGPDRKVALKRALGEIVVRLTGKRSSLRHDVIRKALQKPEQYVVQYRYSRETMYDGRSGDDQRTVLQAEFQPRMIQQLLREAEQRVWVSGRQSTLVWLLVDDARGKSLVNPKQRPDIARLVEQEMARRGLPVQWPRLDASDTDALPVETMWRLPGDTIWDASTRYQASSVLAGRAALSSGGRWLGNWIHLSDGNERGVDVSGGALKTFVSAAVDELADSLAEQYAVQYSSDDVQEIGLVVQGVYDFDSYARALQLLQGLSVVRNVNPGQVDSTRVAYLLTLEGGLDQFQRQLSMHGLLRQVASPADADPAATTADDRVQPGIARVGRGRDSAPSPAMPAANLPRTTLYYEIN